jgi:hypothetical protein
MNYLIAQTLSNIYAGYEQHGTPISTANNFFNINAVFVLLAIAIFSALVLVLEK